MLVKHVSPKQLRPMKSSWFYLNEFCWIYYVTTVYLERSTLIGWYHFHKKVTYLILGPRKVWMTCTHGRCI